MRVHFSIIAMIASVAMVFGGTLTIQNIALATPQVKIDSQDNCKEVSGGTQVDLKFSWSGFDPNTPLKGFVLDEQSIRIIGSKNIQGTSNGSGSDDITVTLNNADKYLLDIKSGSLASQAFELDCSNTKPK